MIAHAILWFLNMKRGLWHLYFIMTAYGGRFCYSIKAMASTLSISPMVLSLVKICNAIVAVCGPLILTWFYCCCVIFCVQGNLIVSDIGLPEKRIYHAALNGNNSLPSVLHQKDD